MEIFRSLGAFPYREDMISPMHLHKNIKNRLSKLFKPFAMLLFFLSALYGGILFGHIILKGDIFSYQLPEKLLIREALNAGLIPFLNPFILCGTPLLENMDAGVFNPFNVLLLAGNDIFAFNLFIFAHYLFAAICMYFFLGRGFGLNRWISSLGAGAYVFGYLWSVSDKGFYRCGYLIPLLFLILIKLFQEKNKYRQSLLAISMSVVLSLLLTCGNFLEAYFSVIFAGIFVLFVLASSFRQEIFPENLKTTKLFVFCVILSAAISGPLLLPVILNSYSSYRANGLSLLEAQQWSFPPIRLFEYFIPYIFGDRSDNGLWVSGIYKQEETFTQSGSGQWADCIYIGIPLILGFIVFAGNAKTWEKRFILFSLILSLLLAFGKFSPVYGMIYSILPGFKMFRHPEKFMYWVNFFLIIGGCIGLQHIYERNDWRHLKKLSDFILLILLSASTLLLVVFCSYPEKFSSFFQNLGSSWNGEKIFLWLITMVSITLISLLLVRVVCAKPEKSPLCFLTIISFSSFLSVMANIEWTMPEKDLRSVHSWDEKIPEFDRNQWRIFSNRKFNYPLISDGETGDEFRVGKLMEQANLYCNLPTVKKIRTVSGFSPNLNAEYVEFMNFENHNPDRVLDLLSVKFICVQEIPVDKVPAGSKVVYENKDAGVMILQNCDSLPRIKTYSSFIKCDTDDFMAKTFDPSRNIHNSFTLCELPSNYKSNICNPDAKVKFLKSGFNGTVLEIQDGPSWIVVRDWYLKGWNCHDERGNRLPIVKADGGLMAFFVDSKSAKVTLSYRPPGLNIGIAVMLVGLLILILYFVFSHLKKFKRNLFK
jgi:hypothetical protein